MTTTTRTNAAGFAIDTLGRVIPGSAVTGPTDPESPFGGREITLTAVRMDEVRPGMVIGGFAQWVQGGAQPLNLLSAIMVSETVQRPVWKVNRYCGQRVTVAREGCSYLSNGKPEDVLYEVTFP